MSFSTSDSIVAIATPPGRGGIGVVRLSGPDAASIAQRLLQRPHALVPRQATFSRFTVHTHGDHDLADEVIATLFQAPASYTGEDVVEISAHGNPIVLRGIVQAAMNEGARLAAPGEFTLRSFLNGKRDLIQAEAVADLINAATPLQARTAYDQLDGTLTHRISQLDAPLYELIARLEASLDFPDEGFHFLEPDEAQTTLGRVITEMDSLLSDSGRGRLVREGATVVVYGRPNVGKSSVFNALAGSDRAIVTPIAGTTRDLVTEALDIGGIAATVVDTAGWRHTDDLIEGEGVARGEKARQVADLTVLVLDRSQPLRDEDLNLLGARGGTSRLIVLNKSDLPPQVTVPCIQQHREAAGDVILAVSALTGEGIDRLRDAIVSALTHSERLRDAPAISNVRHIALLEEARTHLRHAREAALAGGTPEEFLLTDLQAARANLVEVVGKRTSDDLLAHIFARFCIGK